MFLLNLGQRPLRSILNVTTKMKRRASDPLQSEKAKMPRSAESDDQDRSHHGSSTAAAPSNAQNEQDQFSATSDNNPLVEEAKRAEDAEFQPNVGSKSSAARGSKEFKVNQLAQLQQDAKDLWMAMGLLIEIHRHAREMTGLQGAGAREQAQLERVCELVVEKKLLVDPISKLPFTSIMQFEKLHEMQQRRMTKENQRLEYMKEVDEASTVFEAALLQKLTATLPEKGTMDQSTMPLDVHNDVEEKKEQLRIAQGKLSSIEDEIRNCKEAEHRTYLENVKPSTSGEQDIPSQGAENFATGGSALNNRGPHGENEQSHVTIEPSPMQQAERSNENYNDNGVQKPFQGQTQTRTTYKTRRSYHPRSSRIEKRRATHPTAMYLHYDASRSAKRGRVDIRDITRDNAHRASKAAEDVARLREDQRDYYYQDLHELLKGRERQGMVATKLDFDHIFFLEQVGELHYKQSKELRAMYKEEMTSNFGDWTEDRYDDSGFQPDCPIWLLEEERITIWVDSERQRLGLNTWP